jgi:hypothetical protein
MYEQRFYRHWSARKDLIRTEIAVGESDLLILSDKDVKKIATQALRSVRGEIESYISEHPEFKTSLEPLTVSKDATETIRDMAKAGSLFSVGPMAAVAGAVAQSVGIVAKKTTSTLIVENGGDIFAVSDKPLTVALYAGESSPFTDKLAFEIPASEGVGVCTSSGKVGPSFSFGRADAVVAIHHDAMVADAAATAIANRIKSPEDVEPVVEAERERALLEGLIVCMENKLGLWGDFELKRR